MEIRVGRDEDWAELKRVRLKALEDTPQAFASTLAEERGLRDDEWHRRATPTQTSANFLALEEGEAHGLVAVFREADDPDLAHLVAMWVDPTFRQRGVGGQLVDAVVRWCDEHDVGSVHLWVVESNAAAERLYRAREFLPTGARQPLPSDPSLSEFEMVRRLRPTIGSDPVSPRSILEDAFAHHVWATQRLIDVCAALTPEQLAGPVPGTYGSIRDTVRHLVGSDAWYLFVIGGGSGPRIDEEAMDLGELREVMERHAAAWSSVLEKSSDPDVELVAHRDDGTEGHAPLGIRLAQVLHHGTDHRSQICTGLTALGITPPDIDVWAFGELDGRVLDAPAG